MSSIAMDAPLIQLDGVSKFYGKKQALRDISLTVGKGEIVGLLGRNGAGKSTMLNVLTGYLPVSEGRVSIGGADMAEKPREAKRHIGYLPELPPLYDSMTAMEYLRFVAKIKRMKDADIEGEAGRICGEVGLLDVRNRLLRNLSKGYRQRAGVAQAMLGRPDILILDEPTAGLDPKQIVEIRSLIHNFGLGRTVLISSHILSEIAEICERILILREGELVNDCKIGEIGASLGEIGKLRVRAACEEDECERILRNVAEISSLRFIGVEEAGSSDWEIGYDRGGADVRPAIFDALAEAGGKLLMMKPVEADIEDIFLRMTASEERHET
ncbi:MAG: ABC transporter ATP-binding protein [Synergistaceae bacterium]|jgi:ABC-2 type transport system ATP-binding protein|nr:ABC transporter ATP-binding protein [Synergistaceae bacterium]